MRFKTVFATIVISLLAFLAIAPSAVNFGGVDSAPSNGYTIAPNDNTDLTTVTRSIWIGTGGDIEVIYAGNDADLVLKNQPSGFRLWGRFRRVRAAGTTATNLIGEY